MSGVAWAEDSGVKRALVKQPAPMRGWCDIAPQDYSDLMPYYREVPDALNAVPLLLEAKSELVGWDEMRGKLRQFRKGEIAWDLEYWEKAVKKNQNAKRLLDQALKKPWLQIAMFESPDSETTGLMLVMTMAQFQQMIILQALGLGEMDEAQEVMGGMMKLSKMALKSDGALVGWLVGVASYQVSLQMVKVMIQNPACELKHLKVIEKQLANMLPSDARLQEAYRSEFRGFMKYAGDFYQGRLKLNSLMGGQEREGFDEWSRNLGVLIVTKLAMQPNKTFQMYAEMMRYGVISATTPRWKLDGLPKPQATQRLDQEMTAWSYLSPNIIGRQFFSLAAPIVLKQREKMDELKLQTVAIQTLVALRGYQMEHGSLPDQLEKLTPDFLPKLPIDPYDGKPLRYSAEKKRIWSIGTDGKDSSGMEWVKPFTIIRKMPDEPTWMIRFPEK